MSIKITSDKEYQPVVVAELNFRYLEEVNKWMDKLREEVRDSSQLLKSFEAEFARVEALASSLHFQITPDTTDIVAPRFKKSPIITDRIRKIVIPNASELRKNFAIVADLYKKRQDLIEMDNKVRIDFKDTKGADRTLMEIRKLRALIDDRINDAFQFLQKVATKHAPMAFLKFVKEVGKFLSDTVEYSGFDNYIYVHENKEKNLEFTYYIHLMDFVDGSGDTVPSLYIVLTCVLESDMHNVVNVEYYANTLFEFQVPGKFSLGNSVDTVKSAILAIGLQLEMDGYVNDLGTLPMNVNPKSLKPDNFSMREKITDVNGDENMIEFVLIPAIKTRGEATDVANHLLSEVRELVSGRRGQIQTRIYEEFKRWRIRYRLTGLAGPGQVSITDLDWLRERLGVPEDKLRKLVRVINGD